MSLLDDNDWRDLDEQAQKRSNLNDETWKAMREAAEKITSKLAEDALFGTRPPYSTTAEMGARPFNTGRMAPSFGFRRPMFVPDIPIIITPFLTETVRGYRKRKRSFWEKILRLFWEPVSFFPYTPVKLYEEEVPAMAWLNGKVYCHPALADVIRKAMEGKYAIR